MLCRRRAYVGGARVLGFEDHGGVPAANSMLKRLRAHVPQAAAKLFRCTVSLQIQAVQSWVSMG